MCLAGWTPFEDASEMLSVVLALFLSLTCMAGLLILVHVKRSKHSERFDRALRALMATCALLIGFAWEQSFDTSVDALADQTKDSAFRVVNPHSAKLALSVFCASLLIPAWKWHMLPYIVAEGWKFEQVLKVSDIEKVLDTFMKEQISGAKKHKRLIPMLEKKVLEAKEHLNIPQLGQDLQHHIASDQLACPSAGVSPEHDRMIDALLHEVHRMSQLVSQLERKSNVQLPTGRGHPQEPVDL